MRRFVPSFAFLLIFSACATGEIQLSPEAGLSGVVTPNSTVTVKGTFAPVKNPRAILHELNGRTSDDTPLPATVSANGLEVKLPGAMSLGSYYLVVSDDDGSQMTVPGLMTVIPDAVKLDSIHPATQYKGNKDLFNFDLVGDNFSTDARNDDVWIAGQGSILQSKDAKGTCDGLKLPCLWVQNSHLMHVVGYQPEEHQGPVTVSVRVGNVVSGEEKKLVLAKASATAVMLWSALITALLFFVVGKVVSSGLKGQTRHVNLLQSFIVDPETNSYSLSKFQLLTFSVTFIFAYLYVLLSRWLVQWQFALPDIPSTIAGLLGISAGTTVASAGLTSARGSKGAGLQHPTGADLIATGGVVVPERFQFFVWTIIACGGFLALLVGQDPATLTDFPTIPEGLLYIMGVSAAGYLGGKASRKPGPVIQNIALDQISVKWPILIVQGQNLSSAGSFYIDGKELPIVPDSIKKDHDDKNMLQSTPQPGGSDTSFCTELKITIMSCADADLGMGEHRFRIVNKDGQFADVVFTANPPKVIAVVPDEGRDIDNSVTLKKLPASDQLQPVLIAGLGLVEGSKVTWLGEEVKVESRGSADGRRLKVSLVPGKATTGLLVVETPSGFKANATVMVGDIANTPRNKTEGTQIANSAPGTPPGAAQS